jgi:hypothetical protein
MKTILPGWTLGLVALVAFVPPLVGDEPAATPIAAQDRPAERTSEGDIACYFSPNGGCTDAIVSELNQTRQAILVQA